MIQGLIRIRMGSVPLPDSFSPPYDVCVYDSIREKAAFIDVNGDVIYLNFSGFGDSAVSIAGNYFSDVYLNVKAHPSTDKFEERSAKQHRDLSLFYFVNRDLNIVDFNLEDMASRLQKLDECPEKEKIEDMFNIDTSWFF